MNDLTISNDAQDQSIATLFETTKQLNERLTALEVLVKENSKEAKEQLDTAALQLQGEIKDAVDAAKAEMKTTTDDLQRQITENQAALDEEIGKVREEIGTVDGKLDGAIGRIVETETEIATLNEKYTELSSKIGLHKLDVEKALLEQKKNLEAYAKGLVDALTETVTSQGGDIEDLKKSTDKLLANMEKLQKIGGEDLSQLFNEDKLTAEINKIVDDVLPSYIKKDELVSLLQDELDKKVDKEEFNTVKTTVENIEKALNDEGGIKDQIAAFAYQISKFNLSAEAISQRLTSLVFVPDT